MAASQVDSWENDPDKSTFACLYRLTRDRIAHVHRDHLGREKRSVSREENFAINDHSAVELAERLLPRTLVPASGSAKKEATLEIHRLLAQLPGTDREILVMRFLEAISVKEVAQILGISQAAVDMRQLRALRNVRSHLIDLDRPLVSDILGDFDVSRSLDISDIDRLATAVRQSESLTAYDLTGDDVFAADDLRYWTTQLANTWTGDVNLDGEFNSNDLVAVFQAGKYETRQVASWREGDWTGDGIFTTADFVIAFEDGAYDNGRRLATQTVPESSTLSIIVIALVGLSSIIPQRRSRFPV